MTMAHTLTGSGPTGANDMPEAEVIRLACQGDFHAFERLYKLHSRRVYGVCLRMTGNPAEAEDLTQEFFARFLDRDFLGLNQAKASHVCLEIF